MVVEPTVAFTYLPGFLRPEAATALFEALATDVDWQQEWLQLYGRRTAVPRLLAWYGDEGVNYRYSGADHVCAGWLPALDELRKHLAAETAFESNLVLMNRYRSGADYLGWHTDDERGLASMIASVSLGATRRFLLCRPDRRHSHRLDLEHGSLLVMHGALRHSLPRTRKVVGERINLTFRRVESTCR